jgi:hypothetical protein
VVSLAHYTCPCRPCQDLRAWTYGDDVICFFSEAEEDPAFGYKGTCIDPWRQGCVCLGVAADGECEGCWMWLK